MADYSKMTPPEVWKTDSDWRDYPPDGWHVCRICTGKSGYPAEEVRG